jgi:mitofilin
MSLASTTSSAPKKAEAPEPSKEAPKPSSKSIDLATTKSGFKPAAVTEAAAVAAAKAKEEQKEGPSNTKSEEVDKAFSRDEAEKKIRDEIEEEMKSQLKRQLAAYNDYLQEQLLLQEEELHREHVMDVEDKVLAEKIRYQQELATSIHRLQEVEQILEVREKLDIEEGRAREIWLVCQILMDALKSDPTKDVTVEPRSIKRELSAVIDKTKSETNTLTTLALKSIPKAVLEQGVYSEDALVTRFSKIERLCKRVSLIGDEGGSLFRYLLSYLQSMLIVKTACVSEEELADKEVDPSSWDTYDILARVRHHLDHRNLEMSLRYANQLKGEPRKVAKGWIQDVRLHLETRQAANILKAQAAATSVRTLNN